MWRDAGAGEVRNLDKVPGEEARAFLAQADFVWFPGGDQERLMRELRELELVDAVHAAHARGAVVGGTSAGAAVMSARMIAGPPNEDGLRANVASIAEGLGLWPGVVVDQHFVQRDRYGRLIAAVLDAPEIVGVGISERTAAIVTFEHVADDEPVASVEVIGESTLVVVDGRRAKITSAGRSDGLHVARGLAVDVLPSGERWRP